MNDFIKVVLIVSILLTSIIGSGIYTNSILARDSNLMEERITQMENHLKGGDWQSAEKELVYVKEYWSKKQGNWAVLQSHFEIDNIDASFTKVTEFINSKELSLALAESALLKQFIMHIPKNVSFSLENIL
ncbi:MAG TPA: DUF4363 family protein [Clostridiales bacterium]|nr:DUF4363 family protein [Clostridiales bacterium]